MSMKFYKVFLFVFVVFFSTETLAEKRGLNIYGQSRSLPSKGMYGEKGNMVKLSDFQGQFVIAVFWSRYCTPCLRELRDITRFVEKTKYDGIKIVMVSLKKEWPGGFEEQRRFLKRFDAENLDIYVDEKNDLTAALGIFTSPVSVLISRDGKEIGRIRGLLKWNSQEVVEKIYQIKAEHG